MDHETEKQLAAMIMEEASRLRIQAERDGVAAYLAKPNVRGRPNPQFLQATVRSIQQSNRIVEVNEMWRRRSVELDYEQRRERRHRHRTNELPCQTSYRKQESCFDDMGDDGLKDEELEQFLRSRVKRGRGAVGSRMDETGPYLPSETETMSERTVKPDVRVKEDWEERVAGHVAPDDQMREWDRMKSKRKQRSCSSEDGEDKELHKERRKHKNDRSKERNLKKKKKKRDEKSSKSSERRR